MIYINYNYVKRWAIVLAKSLIYSTGFFAHPTLFVPFSIGSPSLMFKLCLT